MASIYVSNIGDDTWDGSSPTYVSGTIGPKRSLNLTNLNNITGGETLWLVPGKKVSGAGEFTFNDNGASADTIVSSGTDFTASFKAGNVVRIKGTSEPSAGVNDTFVTVASVTSTTLTLAAGGGSLAGSSTGADAGNVELQACYNNGNISKNFMTGATATNPAYIKGYNDGSGDNPIICGANYGNEDQAGGKWLIAPSADGGYFWFENIDWEGASNSEFIELGDENTTAADMDLASNVTIKNCNFRNVNKPGDNGTSAILIDAGNNINIINCTFDNIRSRTAGSDSVAIRFATHTKNSLVQSCTFTDIGGDGIAVSIVDGDSDYDISNNIIENCTFQISSPYQYRDYMGNVVTAPSYGDYCGENGIDAKGGGSGNIIRNCIFKHFRKGTSTLDQTGGPGQALTFHEGASGYDIYNNLIEDCTQGLTIGAPTAGDMEFYGSFHNNIIRHGNNNGTPLTYDSGVIIGMTLGQTDNLEIYNNIFDLTDPATTTIFACGTSAQDIRAGTVIKNNIFMNGGNFTEGSGTIEPTASNNCYYNLDEAVPLYLTDASDIEADPLLDDNYNLRPGSPCIGAGVKPLSSYDYSGKYLASSHYDIGAIWSDSYADTKGGFVPPVLGSSQYGEGASQIAIEDYDENLEATNVEDALAEVTSQVEAPPAAVESVSLEFSAIAGTSSALPTNSGAVRLHALGDCFVEFGDESVTADGTKSIYMAHGTEIFGVPAGATHVAVKGAGESGLLSVTGLGATYKHQLTTNAVIPVQAGSSSLALPAGRMVRIFAMTDCFIEFGDATVTADNTSMFFEAGTEVMRVPSGATHVAVKRYALNGGLYISGVN